MMHKLTAMFCSRTIECHITKEKNSWLFDLAAASRSYRSYTGAILAAKLFSGLLRKAMYGTKTQNFSIYHGK
jgi:hypothetical protein